MLFLKLMIKSNLTAVKMLIIIVLQKNGISYGRLSDKEEPKLAGMLFALLQYILIFDLWG